MKRRQFVQLSAGAVTVAAVPAVALGVDVTRKELFAVGDVIKMPTLSVTTWSLPQPSPDQLRALLEAYEPGRVIRIMPALQQIQDQ